MSPQPRVAKIFARLSHCVSEAGCGIRIALWRSQPFGKLFSALVLSGGRRACPQVTQISMMEMEDIARIARK